MKFNVYGKEIEIDNELVEEYESLTRDTFNDETIEYLLISGDANPNDDIETLKNIIIRGMEGDIETIKVAPAIIQSMKNEGLLD